MRKFIAAAGILIALSLSGCAGYVATQPIYPVNPYPPVYNPNPVNPFPPFDPYPPVIPPPVIFPIPPVHIGDGGGWGHDGGGWGHDGGGWGH